MRPRALAEYALVAALISAALAAVYWPALDPEQADVVGRFDVYRQFGPWNYFYDRALAGGDFATWDPLVFSGAPHAANPQSWALYPPNVLRAWLSSAPTPLGTLRSMGALLALHLVVWALGIYRLARAHELPREASFVAVLVGTLSALMVRRVCEWHFLFTLGWLPFLLLAARRLVHECVRPDFAVRRALPPALGISLFFALSVLGGFLQIMTHIALGLAAYTAGELWVCAPRERRRGAALRVSALGALAALLALGLAAIMLVPASELLAHSPRAAGSGAVAGGHKPEAWDLAYAAKSLLVYSGRIYEVETLRGAGVIALALALASLAGKRLRPMLPVLGMLYVLLDLMLGRPLPFSLLIWLVSPVQLVSGTRAFDVAMLPFALMSGFGVVALRERRWASSALAVAVSVAGVLLLRAMMANDDVWVRPDASVWLVPLAFALSVAGAAALHARLAPFVGAAALLLVAAELLTWNRFYAPRLLIQPGFDRQWKTREDFAGARPFWRDNRRGLDDTPNFALFSLRAVSNGYDPLYIRDYFEAFSGEPLRGYKRSIKEGALAESPRPHLFLKRPFWLVPQVVRGSMPPGNRLFAPTEVAFVREAPPAGIESVAAEQVLGRAHSRRTRVSALSARTRTSARKSEWQAEAPPLSPVHHVLVATFLPKRSGVLQVAAHFTERGERRSVTGYRQRVEARADEPLELAFPLPDMVQPRIRLSSEGGRDAAPVLQSMVLHEDLADEDAQIEVVRRTADTVEVNVKQLAAPRLLAFIDVDYPGWHSYVDGKEVSYVRVNDTFKGVWLGAGSHRVRFEFASPSLRTGTLISLLTLLACAGLCAYAWRTTRRVQPDGR